MKFNIGEWVTKPGVKICNCQQVREAKLSPDGRTLSLFCVGYTRDERALDGPALFLTITAPRRDILEVEAVHFKGSAAKVHPFELDETREPLAFEEGEGAYTVSSGELKLVIAKNPCAFTYYYRGRRITSVGSRYGIAQLSTISTPEGPFMRCQLEENNRKMWRMVEDERELRAAIAHDIRSPLSVLKGYQEMLLIYLPDGTIDTPQAVEMLEESMKQISRMDVFIETMRRVNSLEQRELRPKEITVEQLREDIRRELYILAKGKEAVLDVQETKEIFRGDREVILEVAENLLSNALRYAKEQIRVQVSLTATVLKISVSDDGNGFQEDAEKITRAFHQKNVKDSLTHTGMGMYISRLYCEKHGGKLLLENNEAGGAAVTAVFGTIK